MKNSRSLDDLNPLVRSMAKAFIERCKAEGIDLLVTSTFRDDEAQNDLYAQGRSRPGSRVTNAKGGESWHNYRVAFDVVPLRNGKPVWRTVGDDGQLWLKLGALGKACGLEWAGDWLRFPEFPHFQYTGGLTLNEVKSGKPIL